MRKVVVAAVIGLGLSNSVAAFADDFNLVDFLSKLPKDQKLGAVLTKAQAETMRKAYGFDLQFDPNKTPTQILADIKQHMTPGVKPGAKVGVAKPKMSNSVFGVQTAAPVAVPKSYNFFTGKTARCLFDGPMSQFSGTCWAHAAAVAVSTAICKSEVAAGSKIDNISYWMSPEQFVTCLDDKHLGADFTEGTPYGDGYWSGVAINQFVSTGSPFVDYAKCAPQVGCSFGKWNKDGVCEAAASKFPKCVSAARPACASTNGAIAKRNYVNGAFAVQPSGVATEKEMQQALLAHGPLIVSIESFDDLSAYGGGIYTHKKPSKGWSTNHAVIVYGWGEEKGRKYWLMMNSWGKDRGVDVEGKKIAAKKRDGFEQFTDALGITAVPSTDKGGFYKIARGENMVGIESYPVYVDALPNIETRDLALTLARPSAPALVSKWQNGDSVSLAKLTGDAFVELDFYLPAELLGPDPKRVVGQTALRLYAQSCNSGDKVPGTVEVQAQVAGGAWSTVGTQTCVSTGDVQPEVDVTDVVNEAIARSPAPAPAGIKLPVAAANACPANQHRVQVQCVKAPCPTKCVANTGTSSTAANSGPGKVTLRVRAAAGSTVAFRLATATRTELFPGGTPPAGQKSQNPDEDYVAPPAYTWPPILVKTAVKTDPGVENGAAQFFPRLRFETVVK